MWSFTHQSNNRYVCHVCEDQSSECAPWNLGELHGSLSCNVACICEQNTINTNKLLTLDIRNVIVYNVLALNVGIYHPTKLFVATKMN